VRWKRTLPKTIKEYRSIKLKEGLVESIEDYLETEHAKKLGIDSISEAVRYIIMQYLDKKL